jgi:gamma-glutamyltranspeptidase/glutathione hydrolase
MTVSPLHAIYFQMYGKSLGRTAEGRAFMSQAADALPKTGDRFVQTDLAKTLRGVAKDGASYMYTGAWGQQFVDAVRRDGGKATMEDMKRYQPVWEEPLSTTFSGHTVYAPGKSNPGATKVLEALNLAEAMQLDKMGSYYRDAKAFRALSRILEVASYDGLPVPQLTEWKRQEGLSSKPEDRITKSYAKALGSALGQIPNGEQDQGAHHSDSVVVVDRWGNVAALVHSINTMPWGTTGIVVGGIPISDAAGFQQARLAGIMPGDPVPQDEAPVIAMTGAKPSLAVATIGVSLMPETVRLLVGVLANHLDAQTAMAAPAMLANIEPQKAGETFVQRPLFLPEGAYDAEFLKNCRELGINIQLKPMQEVYGIKGTAVLGTIDSESGVLRSVETPGVFGFAAAY